MTSRRLSGCSSTSLRKSRIRSVWAPAAVAPKSSSASAIRLAAIVQPKATLGAARAASSPNSKLLAEVKPNRAATRLPGKD